MSGMYKIYMMFYQTEQTDPLGQWRRSAPETSLFIANTEGEAEQLFEEFKNRFLQEELRDEIRLVFAHLFKRIR